MEEVREEPLFVRRVAGLDIAKAGVEVTIRVPSDTISGRRQQETRTFGTTRRQLLDLACRLTCAFVSCLERAFSSGGFPHVVVGCRVAVLRSWWPAGSGLAGFGCTGGL